MNLPVSNAIWVGSALGPVHAACLSSFVAVGHRTVLHCYSPPTDVPAGVEIADARELMPESAIICYRKSGSYSLFSNLYRLKILEAGLGLYIDCDVYCLKPIPDQNYIFGFETDKQLNGAVLKLPSDSKALTSFLAATSDRTFIPPWFKTSRRWSMNIRKAMGIPVTVDKLPWGTLGPSALTYFAREAGVIARGEPPDVFYSVPFSRVGLFVDPEVRVDDLVTSRTLCLHLYHQKLRPFLGNIPPTSPLGVLMRRVDVYPAQRSSGAVSLACPSPPLLAG